MGIPTNSERRPFRVHLLGLTDFEEVQKLQRRLVYDLGETGGASLILCEHPLTISVGRMGSRAQIAPDDDELRVLGVKVRWINRGGGCILHAPGQLAAYLALPLNQFGLTVQNYLDRLQAILVNALEEFDLQGGTRDDAPGIFLNHARVGIAAIAVNRWIAYHGMTLNVSNYLGWQTLLKEPGPNGLPLAHTTIEARRQRPIPMPKVRETMINLVQHAFDLEPCQLFTRRISNRREELAHYVRI